jgi:dTDP-4-amino-4,6-dideoxygalactose transaminase
MKSHKYDSWPLGPIPKEKLRTEIAQLKEHGYVFKDAREVIEIFERKISDFAGCKHAVLVDCCSNGVFLCLKYLQEIGELNTNEILEIPSRTYVSIPMQIKHAGHNFKLTNETWSGIYKIGGTRVWDGAVRWTKSMYVGSNALQVCSFQLKKRVPIGKGGVIMTNDSSAAEWLKLASYDGRDLSTSYEDPNHFKTFGYHYYMTPEDAARGIMLMDKTPETNEDSGGWENYPDLKSYSLFTGK